jgi:hypothetical protein
MPLCFYAKHAEAAVFVVEGGALCDAGDFLGRGSALWYSGGQEWGFILPRRGFGLRNSLQASFPAFSPDG